MANALNLLDERTAFAGAINEQVADMFDGIAYETVELLPGDEVMVPRINHSFDLRPLLQQAAILSGRDYDEAETPLPAVRLVGMYTLAAIYGGIPIAGLLVSNRQEVWLNRTMREKMADAEHRPYRDSVVVHELVHWLQYLASPTTFGKDEPQAMYIEREVEAFQAQFRYLEQFGLDLSPFIGVTEYDDIRDKVHAYYDGIRKPVAEEHPIVWIDRFDQRRDDQPHMLRERLDARVIHRDQSHWRMLGSGSRGHVYAHPALPGQVVKIGRYDRMPYQVETEREPQDAYLWYLQRFQNCDNPHFPRVQTVIRYPHYYIAIMERLYDVRWATSFNRGATPPNDMPEASSFKRFYDQVCGAANEIAFRDFYYDRHVALDLNRGGPSLNILRRKHGTLVITDPYY